MPAPVKISDPQLRQRKANLNENAAELFQES
jgi:hypothetical protein